MADEKVRTGGVAYGSYIRTSAANNILAYSELIHDDQFSAYTDTQNTFNNTDQHSINEYLLSLIGTGGNGSSVSYNQSTGELTINGETFTLNGLNADDKAKLDAITGSVYLYKGSVATYNDLPTFGVNPGDVYNVQDTGMNYACVANNNSEYTVCNSYDPVKIGDVISISNVYTIVNGENVPAGLLQFECVKVDDKVVLKYINSSHSKFTFHASNTPYETEDVYLSYKTDSLGNKDINNNNLYIGPMDFVYADNLFVCDEGLSPYKVDYNNSDNIEWDALGATVSNNPGTLIWQ